MRRTKGAKAYPECLVPGCGRHIFSRGLCKGHYVYAAKLVRNKEYSWAKLEKEGKVFAPKKGARASSLREWFESK